MEMGYEEKLEYIKEMAKRLTSEEEQEAVEISKEILEWEMKYNNGEAEMEEAATRVINGKLKLLLTAIKNDTKEHEYLEGVKEVFDLIKSLDTSDFKIETLSKVEERVNLFFKRLKKEAK